MGFPLSEAQHFGLITVYNLTTWPTHVALYALAFLIMVLAARGSRGANIGIAFLWIWAGAAYFIRLMSVLTPAGYVVGGLFMLQSVLLLKAEFRIQKGAMPSVGGILVIYAMVVYPLVESFLGHGWPMLQAVGLPAPTAMFTLGVFLWAAESIPAYVLVIPVLWAFVGSAPAFLYGSYVDLGLLASGIAALSLFKRKRVSPVERLGVK